MQPKYEWMKKLAEYSVTPQSKTQPYMENKSQINKPFGNIYLDNYTLQKTYSERMDNFDTEQIKIQYLKVYKKQLSYIRPDVTTNYSFYKNGNLTRFITMNIVNQDNSTNSINLFVVNYFPFSQTFGKTLYFLEDENEHLKFERFKLIKMDSLGYIIGIFFHKGKWQLIKLNDIADRRYNINNKCFIISKIVMPKFGNSNPVDNALLFDFNESYSDVDYYDLTFYSAKKNIWYGRAKFDISKNPDWERADWVVYGENQGKKPEFIEDVQHLSVSSLTQTQEGKNKFFGNIVVGTGGKSSIKEPKTFNTLLEHTYDNVHIKLIDGIVNAVNKSWEISKIDFMRPILNKYRPIYENERDGGNSKLVWKKISLTITGEIYSQWIQKYDLNTTKFTIQNDISEIDLASLIRYGENQNYSLVLHKQFVTNDRSVFTIRIVNSNAINDDKNYIWIGSNTELSKFLNEKYNNIIFKDLSVSISLSLDYDAFVITDFISKCFKIVVYDYNKNANKIRFEEDKTILNSQGSAPPLALNNNELYMPVKVANKWYLYLFDNGKYDFNADNIFIKTTPIQIGELRVFNNKIRLIKINNEDGKNPICGIIGGGITISFFYKNLASKDLNINYYFTTDFFVNYDFDPRVMIAWREQNTIKILLSKQPNWRIMNITFNGEDFNITNYPYLFKYNETFNTLKDMMTITAFESDKKEINANIFDFSATNNEINFNVNFKASSLNSIIDLENQTNKIFYLKGANGNIIEQFPIDISKTPYENVTNNIVWEIKWQNENKTNAQYLSNLTVAIFNDFNNNIMKFRNRHMRYTVIHEDGRSEQRYITAINNIIDDNSLTIGYIIYFDKPLKKGQQITLKDFYLGDYSWDDKTHPNYLQRTTWWQKLETWEPVILTKPTAIKRYYKLSWKG